MPQWITAKELLKVFSKYLDAASAKKLARRPKWTKAMTTTSKRKAQNALRSMRRRFTGWADFRLRSRKICK